MDAPVVIPSKSNSELDDSDSDQQEGIRRLMEEGGGQCMVAAEKSREFIMINVSSSFYFKLFRGCLCFS